jgi:hypothetical protein
MAQRSRVRGDKGFRKILKQLPDSARAEMADVMKGVGIDLAKAMQADAPVLRRPRKGRTAGALRAGISYKLAVKSLNLRVGLVGTKRGRSNLFYGGIVEAGRPEQTVKIKRGPRAGSEMKVGAVAAHPFVYKQRPELRRELNARLKSYWTNVLTAAAAGVTDDA